MSRAPLGQLQVRALASLVGVSVELGTSGLALAILSSGTAVLFPRLTRVCRSPVQRSPRARSQVLTCEAREIR